MGRLLLFISIMLVHPMFGQKLSRTYSFDFNHPTTLNPPVNPSGVSSRTSVNNMVFHNDFISLSFGKMNEQTTLGAELVENDGDINAPYYLRMSVGTRLFLNATNGTTIDSIVISEYSTVGNLGLEPGQPGTQSNMNRLWKSNVDTISSLSFNVTGNPAKLHKMTVYYKENAVILRPLKSSISNNDVLSSFSYLDLKYSSPMNILSTDGITITGTIDGLKLNVTAKNDTIHLQLDDPIVTDGDFSISIPSRRFRNSNGYENVALKYDFSVREPRNTFDTLAVIPSPGILTMLPEVITMQFDNDVEINNFRNYKVYKNGMARYTASIRRDSTDKSIVYIENSHGDITESGEWKIVIPEESIHNPFIGDSIDDRWNPEITLTYIVDPDYTGPEPEDTETMKSARMLVELKGVGYPAADSPSRIWLQELVEYTDSIPSDSVLQQAIANFYLEKNVELPVPGQWYTIRGVNATGKTMNLTFSDEGKAVVAKEAGKDVAFQVIESRADTIVFVTQNGKYLHVFTSSSKYEGTSENNLTDTLTAVNDLKLQKFNMTDVDSTLTFGLLTVYGLLGNDPVTGTEQRAYALLNYKSATFATAPEYGLYFTDDLSSGFRFEITDEPQDEYIITPHVTLTPTEITSNEATMTLSFVNVAKVRLLDESKAYFCVAGSDSTITSNAEKIIVQKEGSDSLFTVHVNGMKNGKYELLMPKGTFDYSENDTLVVDKDLKVSFAIVPPPPPVDIYVNYGSLPEMWGTIPTLMKGLVVADTDLLEVYYYVTDVDVYPNKDATFNVVKLSERLMNVLIAQGHFESVERDGQKMLKIVYDESTPLADKLPLPNGDYTLTYGRAAYGDENFNKRQNGDTSIAESDCRVNQRMLYNNLTIDNSKVGINAIGLYETHTDLMYDLQGRCVKGCPNPGVYIINGKKHVVR